MAKWVVRLTRNLSVVVLVLVGSRDGFEHDFTIKLK